MRAGYGSALLLVLSLAGPASAQTAREAGEKLRAALKEPRPALATKLLLPAHLNLARVGELRLETEIVEKGGERLYQLNDTLSVDAKGFGSITMTVTGDLGADLSIRELVLYTSSPNAAGGTTRRKLTVAPEGDALFVTEAKDEEKPTKRKLEGVPKNALLLTPPLGVGERLARLAPPEVGTRLSFDAWDLAEGAKATFTLSLDEVARVDVRGQQLEAQKVTREEGKASLESWLEPRTREPLVVVRPGAERLRFVGRESSEAREDLPAPSAEDRKKEGPAATVLRFLRASGRGDAPAVEALLDLEALFEAAKPADRSDKFKATYKKTLVAVLTSAEWRRGESVKLVADASRVEDLVEELSGSDRARVRTKGSPQDGPSFELVKSAEGWKIAGLPRK